MLVDKLYKIFIKKHKTDDVHISNYTMKLLKGIYSVKQDIKRNYIN